MKSIRFIAVMFALFALSGANQVAVIDVAGRKLVQNFETGLDPDGIGLGR